MDEKNEADIMKAFTKAVEEKIAEHGEITRKLAHSIFIGPPGSGKSSLMYYLLNGKPKKDFSPSTGACDPIVHVIVDINQSALHPATLSVDSDSWNEIKDCKLSFLLQIVQKDPLPLPGNSYPEPALVKNNVDNTSVSELVVESERIVPFSEQNKMVLIEESSMDAAPEGLSLKDEPVALVIPRGIDIRDIIKNEYRTVKNYLQRTSSLYLRDTGGHIEFQEMMPLTIFGPSIFFFVFNANQSLQDTFDIHYRKSSGESLNPYRSSLTIEDTLLQCLASVRAIDVPGEDSVKMHKSLVFIVGTHIDQIKPSVDDKISLLNKQIHSLILRNNFRDLVQYLEEKHQEKDQLSIPRVIFPVNNLSSDDEHFKPIRSSVNCLIWGHESFNIKFPTSYLCVCLELQNVNKNILSLSEFKDVAAKCYIKEDEVCHLLRFLHFKVGVVRYYDAPGLQDIVVVQPQILFSTITDLVIQTFSSRCLFPSEKEEFSKQGLITNALFERVLKSEELIKKGIFPSSTIEESIYKGDIISPKKFLELLEHLRIITPFYTPGDTEMKYFIPFVLNHVPESSGDGLVTDISPLVIKFEHCHTPKGTSCAYHCPKGVFGVLITHLMRPDSTDQTTLFKLDKVYKDQVFFIVGHSSGLADHDIISLRYCCSHLEITFYPDAFDHRNLPIGVVCQNVREIVEKSIPRSLKNLHYSTDKIKPVVCFKCKNENCSEQHPVLTHTRGFRVFVCKKTNRLPKEARCWYNEGECISIKPVRWAIVYA